MPGPMMFSGMDPRMMMMGGGGGGCNSMSSSYMQGFMAAIQMAEMMQLMQLIRGAGGAGAMGPGQQFGANPCAGDNMSRFMGVSGMPFSAMPWGRSPMPPNYGNGSGNSCTAIPGQYSQGGGNGSDAVNLGRQYLGHNSIDIKGSLPHFTAAGGQTNNCADFVSSCLESTGKLQGHHVGVSDLEQSLLSQGYHRVSPEMAKPGDVWMTGERSHTELVAAPGGTRLLGSNNDMPGHQVISEKAHSPNNGIYYSRG